MAALNNTQIPTALPAVTKLDLSCDHVTTMNFGDLQPVHYRHPFKGERLNLSAVGTVRPFPIATPLYGRMRLNLHHFYVPWRVVFPQFDSFYNDTVGVNYDDGSIIDDSPVVYNHSLVQMFTKLVAGVGPYANKIANWSSGDPYDFKNGNDYWKFTKIGKRFYKILIGLGYKINWDDKDQTAYSAMPLLAYCKIYIDWFANQSYMESADIIAIKKLLAFNDPTSNLNLSVSDLEIMALLLPTACFDQDYFTGGWDNPFAPNPGNYSAVTFSDVVTGTSIAADGDGTPYMQQNAATQTSIGSQYLHDALKSITDYSKRHQLAGANNINRALAQYGFGVQNLKYDRSLYLGGSSIDVKTGAVYSTANTASSSDPSTLGDYAGNGFGQGNSSFDYKVDELGIQITIASIMPSGGIFQGIDRNNLIHLKTDFPVPEFDGLGVQLVTKREVYVSNDGNFGTQAQYNSGFSFSGRYAEKKRPLNWVSGDLILPCWFNGGDSWHLMREFDDSNFSGSAANIVHDLGFTRMPVAGGKFNRIFTNQDVDNDRFIAEFHFDVHSLAPCHGLFETYEFDKNGKSVTLENGAVLN